MKVEKQYQLKVYAVLGTPVDKLIGDLVTAAGGVTSYLANGWWRGANGKLVQEAVTIVEVHCSSLETVAVAAALDDYIGACIRGGQEAVGVFTDGEDCQPVFTLHYGVPPPASGKYDVGLIGPRIVDVAWFTSFDDAVKAAEGLKG